MAQIRVLFDIIQCKFILYKINDCTSKYTVYFAENTER